MALGFSLFLTPFNRDVSGNTEPFVTLSNTWEMVEILSGSKNKWRLLLFVFKHLHFNSGVCVVTMQPPVVKMTDCSFFLRSFKQSKATVRLKEDMKKIVAVPLSEQKNSTYKKLFGVSLQDLQQQGLTVNGIPAIVGNIVEYLTKNGKSSLVLTMVFTILT